MLHTRIAVVDELLHAHAARLGADRTGYRNHVYRVANFCLAFAGEADDAEVAGEVVVKVGIAAAMHDIGIWTAGTFDYLEPSIAAATTYLAHSGRSAWAPEITAMIREHHKLTRYRAPARGLVESFRKADWVDVSLGLRRFGLSRRLVAAVRDAWPNAGFHRRLARLSLGRLGSHPWSPLPMLRL